MKRRIYLRDKGKIKLSEYFKDLKEGDVVSIVKNVSQKSNFPDRIQGVTGIVESKRGRSYVIKAKDFNEEKRYIVQAIHLKKLR